MTPGKIASLVGWKTTERKQDKAKWDTSEEGSEKKSGEKDTGADVLKAWKYRE